MSQLLFIISFYFSPILFQKLSSILHNKVVIFSLEVLRHLGVVYEEAVYDAIPPPARAHGPYEGGLGPDGEVGLRAFVCELPRHLHLDSIDPDVEGVLLQNHAVHGPLHRQDPGLHHFALRLNEFLK